MEQIFWSKNIKKRLDEIGDKLEALNKGPRRAVIKKKGHHHIVSKS